MVLLSASTIFSGKPESSEFWPCNFELDKIPYLESFVNDFTLKILLTSLNLAKLWRIEKNEGTDTLHENQNLVNSTTVTIKNL